MSEYCSSCPRRCGKIRPGGFCGMPVRARVARAALHYGEEPCISGKNGSGTVFFCGCNLRCVFCQNSEISRRNFDDAAEFTANELAGIYIRLKNAGAHNINLVTPSHYTDIIAESLSVPPGIPVAYNSSGYDSVDSLKELNGRISIYMPDMKYTDSAVSEKLSHAPDYFSVAEKALNEMYRQVGRFHLDENGMMTKGLLIRHLVLPGHPDNTKSVIDFIYDSFPRNSVMVSLMGQYTPPENSAFTDELSPLNSPLSAEEYEEAAAYLEYRHLNCGYLQYPESTGRGYVPEFGIRNII